jgi:RNA polymerase sigma-70 factor (family 1)
MNPYQNHTDTDLVSLLIEGNERAFAVIYERYAFDLYRYARKNIQDSEDCREIIQDIFESLWKRRAELGHITVLDAYLYRTVKYKIIRYTQHQAVKRKYADHYRLFEAVLETSIDENREPENIEALIEKGLAELPERCQVAVRLRLTENLSNGDIAKRMNITKGTVKNYMVTALNHLRASYERLYKFGG